MPKVEYTFGYGAVHRECWFHACWTYGHDTRHEYWYCPTLGMDGVD